MFRLSLRYVRPGLVVARSIHHANGTLLLGQGVELDNRLIARLATMGVDSVYVKNPYFAGEPTEVISEKTRITTTKLTHNAFETYRQRGTINLGDLQRVIKMLVEDVTDNRQVLIQLTDIRTHDDYTFGHSINTCILSAMIGVKMRLKEHQLKELALGVILHDLGKTLLPKELLNKKEPLLPEERRRIEEHATSGFEVLRQQGSIPLMSAHVAFQHHENYDGSGYPRGLAGEDIHLYARIAAIADLYDAITSDRPYRPAMLPHEAYEVVLGSRGVKLDPAITDLFLENVALFPIGTMVLLDSGETGVVTAVHPGLQARPVVKVILDKFGQQLPGQDHIIDLTKELTKFIVKVFKPEEVVALSRGEASGATA
ncbi:MAG: HD-GYP domain-containing protein [Negativicutes bacterium]|nr:HD-GYP domain-containing protein [Negativicutes bacterium]